jgi:hypothetical protein
LEKTPMAGPVKRHDTDSAAQYLTNKLGIPVESKTLRNWRAGGKKGPTARYFGAKPLYDEPELDRWAEEEALTLVNPVRRNMRLRAERRAAAEPAIPIDP